MIGIEIAVNMKNFGFDGDVLQFVAAQQMLFLTLRNKHINSNFTACLIHGFSIFIHFSYGLIGQQIAALLFHEEYVKRTILNFFFGR